MDFVLADIPGLIEGAHEGSGLGDRFLGHVERCRVLLHLVDVTEPDVAAAYRTIRSELKAYGSGLARKREIVALSKCDAVTPDVAAEKAAELQRAARKKPLLLSAVSGGGVRDVLLRWERSSTSRKTRKRSPRPRGSPSWAVRARDARLQLPSFASVAKQFRVSFRRRPGSPMAAGSAFARKSTPNFMPSLIAKEEGFVKTQMLRLNHRLIPVLAITGIFVPNSQCKSY